MQRDLSSLTARRFDLLVIGGGIHGLWAACDAASRGLAVALVEARDFGGGLSFCHQRTIHGGLRALQTGRVWKTAEQVRERRTWARIAPHHLRPLPFLLGTYGWTTRSQVALRAGFRLYDAVGRHRNRGVAPELHLPAARLESRAATTRLFPGIAEARLTGGAVWYDYQTRFPDRLTWAVAAAARQAGAILVNHVRATAPLRNGARITGASVQEAFTGRVLSIEANVTLLAAGAGLAGLAAAFGAPEPPGLVLAFNLLLDRPARDIALAARGRSGRMLTVVPWHGRALVGTFQAEALASSAEGHVPQGALRDAMDDLNAAFPSLGASPADILRIQSGCVPATMAGGRAELLPDFVVRSGAADGSRGLVTLVGVKYTTARLAAERAIDAVVGGLSHSSQRSTTAIRLLPHSGIADAEGRLVERARQLGATLDEATVSRLADWYATEAPAVLEVDPSARRLTDESSPVLAAELIYAVRHEFACTLADVVLRRTALAQSGRPSRDSLVAAAAVVAPHLGWTAAEQAAQVAAVESAFPSTAG